MTGSKNNLIRNLTFILIGICFAAPSFADDNYDAAGPVENSGNAYSNPGDAPADYNNQSNPPVAAAPIDQDGLADVSAFADTINVAPGDFRACQDAAERCGEPDNEVCRAQLVDCNRRAQTVSAAN